MTFIERMHEKARNLQKTIVLPETTDERTLRAAHLILQQQLAQLILVGDVEEIKKQSALLGLDLDKATLMDPSTHSELINLANRYYERRKKKGMTPDEALETLKTKPLYFGAMLVDAGIADGMVAGALCPTAETLRALFHCVGTKPGSSLVSSFFIMISPQIDLGYNGILLFADCAVNPNPTAEQLADIAIQTADSFRKLFQTEPAVALLSFSTYGSAEHVLVEKVRQALSLCKTKEPTLMIDGELQVDAALIPDIGQRKAKGSTVAGKANCLIFPDLQSGNIGYKLTERFGGVTALGPFLQGAAKPINDLSRGCSVQDIVDITALTAIQGARA